MRPTRLAFLVLCAIAGAAGAQVPQPDSPAEPPDDTVFQDGFETSACDTNPGCLGFTNLGEISGDTSGPPPLAATGTGEHWFRARVTENDDGDVYVSATIVLTVPDGSDYDLYVYCDTCGGGLAGQSTNAGSATEQVTVRVEDEFFGVDDAFDVRIEVRYKSGLICDSWSLQVFGDTPATVDTCD